MCEIFSVAFPGLELATGGVLPVPRLRSVVVRRVLGVEADGVTIAGWSEISQLTLSHQSFLPDRDNVCILEDLLMERQIQMLIVAR